MKSTVAPNNLNKLELPLFWQLFILLHMLFGVFIIFTDSELFLNIANITLSVLTPFGIASAIKIQKHKPHPWRLLTAGSALISLSIILNSLIYFGLNIESLFILATKELGLLFIGLFAFSFMLNFEKELNLKGFTIDFILITLSLVFFVVLVSPNLLSDFLYNINLTQQVGVVNILFGLILFSMTIISHSLSKKTLLADAVRSFMILALIIHFSLTLLDTFSITENNTIMSRASWSFYHLTTSLMILFTFLESLTLNYLPKSSTSFSKKLMWTASILAIFGVPLGVIIRDRLNLPHINTMLTGTTGFVLSSIVIWRFQKVLQEISRQRENLKTIAYVDPLTNLPNFHGYLDQLSNININNIFVLSINIEDFKSINDLYGRDFGDEVLKSLAKRIKMLPENILVARTGADYFHAVFRTRLKDIQKVVDEVQLHLGVWDVVQNCRIAVPLTYGASHNSGFVRPETLARQAEEALKVSREQHTNFTLHTEKTVSNKNSVPRHELREILQKAVDDNYLPVHFQPIYDLSDGSLKALELLIRVESEEHGLLLPGQFLDQAKSYGLLTSLTEVCVNMVAKSYDQLPDVTININMPPYMLNNPQILNNFIQCFKDANLPMKQFCIEVTEDGQIPTDQLIPSINLLKAHGFKIAMDDFGTGYSSLSRLTVLPVDIVKIDRSLLLAASNGDKTILESAISLTKRLGASAVVEGVETLEQLALIKKLGADSVQGFLLSKPVKVSKVPLLSLNATDIIAEF